MGTLFGLLAALLWGGAEFLARTSTRALGTYRTLLYAQFLGLIGMSVLLLATGEWAASAGIGLGMWAIGVVTALLNLISSYWLYRALEVGTLAIVSPIAASYSAVTIVLGWLSGEILTTTHAVGVVIILFGIVQAALVIEPDTCPTRCGANGRWRSKLKLPCGLWWAAGSAISFGVTFWALGFYVAPTFGSLIPVWLIRLTTVVTLLLIALVMRVNIQPPAGGRPWVMIAAIGVMDTTAFLSHTLGLASHQVAIVTVLGSLYSAVAVLLGCIFLHERLHRSQWIGIGLIFAGIVLVSL